MKSRPQRPKSKIKTARRSPAKKGGRSYPGSMNLNAMEEAPSPGAVRTSSTRPPSRGGFSGKIDAPFGPRPTAGVPDRPARGLAPVTESLHVAPVEVLARVAEPRNAALVLSVVAVVFGVAVFESRDRVVGTLQPGAPELRPEARYN